MGQKVNPIGLRLGINRTWDSRWFADGAEYGQLLHEDLKLRTWLKKRLNPAGMSRIIIERPHKKCRVTIYAARPGVVIGKKGADIEKLRKDISALTPKAKFTEHRRSAQARNGRPADRREHRAAARTPYRLPPRHEARDAVGHASRRQGRPHQRFGPPRRR